jgi:hypothetical protein
MSGPIKFMILAIVVGIKKSPICLFLKRVVLRSSIHTDLAKLYSQKVICCLANLAALFDIGHAPEDQSKRRIHLPCYAASEIHPLMALHVRSVNRRNSHGLVAEEVQTVNPDLVAPDRDGKPFTVRYDAVNAMLLNEFLKEHCKVKQLTKDFESQLVEQQKQIEALTAGLQKVSDQLELSKPAPQIVVDKQ